MAVALVKHSIISSESLDGRLKFIPIRVIDVYTNLRHTYRHLLLTIYWHMIIVSYDFQKSAAIYYFNNINKTKTH